MTDHELLAAYAREGSEDAFTELVERHIGLVHAAALRQVRDAHLAEDMTQAVFLTLAKKAGEIKKSVYLPGRLLQTARYAAANALQHRRRQMHHESMAAAQAAFSRQNEESAWAAVAPLLDSALASLRSQDQKTIIMHYFKEHSVAEMASALSISEEAAKKRVSSSLEKLRGFLRRKGIVVPVGILAGLLTSEAVVAAPAGLAATTSAAVLAMAKGSALAGLSAAIAKGVLKMMFWTKVKTAAAVTVAVLAVGGASAPAVMKAVGKKMEEKIVKQEPDIVVKPAPIEQTTTEPSVAVQKKPIAVAEVLPLTLHLGEGMDWMNVLGRIPDENQEAMCGIYSRKTVEQMLPKETWLKINIGARQAYSLGIAPCFYYQWNGTPEVYLKWEAPSLYAAESADGPWQWIGLDASDVRGKAALRNAEPGKGPLGVYARLDEETVRHMQRLEIQALALAYHSDSLSLLKDVPSLICLPDSDLKPDGGLAHRLGRRPVSQSFPRSFVQECFDPPNLGTAYLGKVRPLREPPPHHAMDLFVQPPFPRMIRTRKVEVKAKPRGKRLMRRELPPIVHGQRLARQVAVPPKAPERRAVERLCRAVLPEVQHHVLRPALHERSKPVRAFPALDRVAFPIPRAGLPPHNGGPLLDAHPILDPPAHLSGAVTLATFAAAVGQALVPRSAREALSSQMSS
ncbi:MAG: sigma-70 family RNA polymerase sigma factor [Planctomycetota bacterium]